MDNALTMDMHQCFNDLGEIVACLDLREVLDLSEFVEKRAFAMLDQEKEVVAFPAVFVELEAVLVFDH